MNSVDRLNTRPTEDSPKNVNQIWVQGDDA